MGRFGGYLGDISFPFLVTYLQLENCDSYKLPQFATFHTVNLAKLWNVETLELLEFSKRWSFQKLSELLEFWNFEIWTGLKPWNFWNFEASTLWKLMTLRNFEILTNFGNFVSKLKNFTVSQIQKLQKFKIAKCLTL